MSLLHLDLASSKAKVAGARKHLDFLKRELPKYLREHGPYSLRFSPVDPQTGWCELWLVPANRDNHTFSVEFGELVHDLRCALDYIVTALVNASKTQLTRRHQFPIYREEAAYLKGCGTTAVPTGNLINVTHGLVLIEAWQPYKLKQKGLDPRRDPLWHVHRFSNADKHREIATVAAEPLGKIDIRYKGFRVEDEPVLTFPPNWSPDKEYVIHRMRFDPPVATDLRSNGPLDIVFGFSVPPFGAEPFHSITLSEVRTIIGHVAKLVDLFEQI
jgi:hypothetical protein